MQPILTARTSGLSVYLSPRLEQSLSFRIRSNAEAADSETPDGAKRIVYFLSFYR